MTPAQTFHALLTLQGEPPEAAKAPARPSGLQALASAFSDDRGLLIDIEQVSA